MKIKKQIIIGIMILLAMLLLPNISRATEVSRFESKSGGTLWNNVTITRAYRECYDLRELSAESTLGNNSLDPHLTLNKDWGAVAYLAISKYGATTDYTSYTTTGNATGVQDFGKNYEWTSSLISEATNLSVSEARTDLINHVEGEQYVEQLEQDVNTNVEHSKGMALAETSKIALFHDFIPEFPCLARYRVVGFYCAYNSPYSLGTGTKNSAYRPTIWN